MRVLTFCSSHFIEYAEYNNSYSMMDSRWKKFKTENLLHAEHEPSGPHSLLNYISSLGTELQPWSHARRRLILLGLRGSTVVN